jgi:hypothetical protein
MIEHRSECILITDLEIILDAGFQPDKNTYFLIVAYRDSGLTHTSYCLLLNFKYWERACIIISWEFARMCYTCPVMPEKSGFCDGDEQKKIRRKWF